MRTRILAVASLAALALLAVAVLTLTAPGTAPEALPAQAVGGLDATWPDTAYTAIVTLILLDLVITGRLVVGLLHRITHT